MSLAYGARAETLGNGDAGDSSKDGEGLHVGGGVGVWVGGEGSRCRGRGWGKIITSGSGERRFWSRAVVGRGRAAG